MEAERTHGPVVAGTFYPAGAADLRGVVTRLLKRAEPPDLQGRLRGLIAPHAGYVYSGPVAATAYALLEPGRYDDVVLIGPAHFERFDGVAALEADGWKTPLGRVPLRDHPQASPLTVSRRPFTREHSLEVQLPFLQVAIGDFGATPVLTGATSANAVADVLDQLVGEDTLLVVSTDLSHYEPYETAVRLDRATADAVVSREVNDLAWDAACGLTGLQAAVSLAKRRDWSIQLLDLRNSGDTAGTTDRVVGYGAFALTS